MLDARPVGYVIGLLLAALGATMLIPVAVDFAAGDANALAMLESAMITGIAGGLTALACSNGVGTGLTLQQSFLLTTGTWVVLPLFGALPFVIGAPGVGLLDATFEAMSGMTTTGTTILSGLDELPRGTLLWRSLLQWLGGLGIIIVALVFLPVMKVGGMQYFRAEAFDTLGKILPRALDISTALVQIYVGLTVACAAAYAATGMSPFDAVNHALTTLATGGYSTTDASFTGFSGAPEYVSVLFMILAGLPFVRFVQLVRGSVRPIATDMQVLAYLRWTAYAVGLVAAYRLLREPETPLPDIFREALFNVVSLFSGTGYSSADVSAWGAFPLVVVLVVGFIGSCTASTGCSVKVFRYLVLFEAVKGQLRRILSPNRVVPLRLQGRPVSDDVVNAVIALFSLFLLSFAIIAVLLSLTGLETRTAITAAWTSIANIGPAFGPEVGPTGAVDTFPPSAKWLMIVAMLLGRLELLSVLVLFLPRFWRD